MPPKKQKKSASKPLKLLKKVSNKVSKAPKKNSVGKTRVKKMVKESPKVEQSPLVLSVQTEELLVEHPPVSHLALSGHRSRFEHTWIVVGCFSLMFASLLFLSSQIRAAQDTPQGPQVAQVSAIVMPNPYNTKQKNFFEKWYGSLDPTTKLSLQSGLVLVLLVLISSLLLYKHKPKSSPQTSLSPSVSH